VDEFIFHRGEELKLLHEHVRRGKPFLLHGPAGVGKTLLFCSLLQPFPAVIYCETSTSMQVVFRSLAQSLLERGHPRLKRTCRNRDGILAKSAVSLKGIVMDALREGNYSVVLDHIDRPSQSFAATVREIMDGAPLPLSLSPVQATWKKPDSSSRCIRTGMTDTS